jgi:glyoxylase-like metal-dependent hydrolase (beta-lactamase superfamily II)
MKTQSHGITTLDIDFVRPQFGAAYLIIENGRAAFIDCGTNFSVPGMLSALRTQGLDVDAVDWVIPTHVHLDHAGGAGELMRQLPNARLVIHPRGEQHMVDPSRLVAGATAVYGEEFMRRTYGEIVPVDAQRVVVAHDGHRVDLGGRSLLCIDTPGHARHHFCVWDAQSRSFFTGDTFGLSYREFDTAQGAFILPTTSPVQFDPEALCDSIRKLLSYEPQTMYLTHFGGVSNAPKLAEDLRIQIDAMVAIARASAQAGDRHARIMRELSELYVSRAIAHGIGMSPERIHELLAIDIELNAQGLEVWLDR